MDREKEIFRILKEKYGITTEQQLNEAIRKQGFLNIAPFVSAPKSDAQPPSRSQE